MIKNLTLRNGKAPGLPQTKFDCTPITVFVGPNNSGKSRILQELFSFFSSPLPKQTDVILHRAEFESFSQNEVEAYIDVHTLKPRPDESVAISNRIIGKQGRRVQVNPSHLTTAMMAPNSDAHSFCNGVLSYNTLILNGKKRIDLVQPQSAGDLLQPPQTSFQVLFKDDAKRTELRRIVYEAFGQHLIMDPTNVGQLRLRLSSVPPPSPAIERGLHSEAVDFQDAAQSIEQSSDGIKAFTGLMTEIIVGDPAVLLIDEPEAFLHPSLSFLLGREISRATTGSQKRLFVSTHSAHFLMGCVQAGTPITIVRLTYRDGVRTARMLESSEILRLMRNPLLRSTGVLNALFYESVVVTESDTDRAFYQEINERLQFNASDGGIRNCVFLNAQNKQTVPSIVRPLRNLGIAAAGIVDIDVIKDGGSTWTAAMEGVCLPEMDRAATAHTRSAANKAFEVTGRDMKRDGGINLLVANDREAVENLFDRLAKYGLFVVPGGELESWLKDLGSPVRDHNG